MYHIVKMNEKIEQIADIYNLDIDEIKSCNQHIRNWDGLIAGTKLLLPAIPRVLRDELNDVEPFIEEYYPKISDFEMVNKKNDENDPSLPKNDKPETIIEGKQPPSSSTNKLNHPKSSIFYNGYYYPNSYPFPYYPYYRKRKNKQK